MKDFNYSATEGQKRDSALPELVAAVYKETQKQKLYWKQRLTVLEQLLDIEKNPRTEASSTAARVEPSAEEKAASPTSGEQTSADQPNVLDQVMQQCKSLLSTKVYVGRRSMSMGDDANHPNMFSFRLSNDPAAVVKAMYSHGLPSYTSWEGYLGKRKYSGSEEDGVTVYSRFSDEVLFRITESKRPDQPSFEFTEGWYWKLILHPYIYCE